MGNKVAEQQIVQFRQTLNTYTKQWCVPKKKVGNKWIPIINLKYVVTKKSGICYAIWRLKTLMGGLKCTTHNQSVWKCSTIGLTKKGVYNIYTLTCKRIKHSIMGVM